VNAIKKFKHALSTESIGCFKYTKVVINHQSHFLIIEPLYSFFEIFLFFMIICVLAGCTPPLEDKNPDTRRSAVGKLTNQLLLVDIAMKDTDESIRMFAVDRITDQSLLAEITMKNLDLIICKAAFEKITDQSLLTEIATEDRDVLIRRAAIEKLKDQSQREKIAIKDTDASIRKFAVETLITDQSLLTEIAMKDTDESVRRTAIEKLTGQSLSTTASVDEKDLSSVRQVAVEKNIDLSLSLPSKIAVEDKDASVRKAAAEKLNEQLLRSAFSTGNIPQQHQARLASNLLPILFTLSDPDVVDEVGDIESLSTAWSPTSAKYVPNNTVNSTISQTVPGERFSFSIKLKKLKNKISFSWSTSFPVELIDVGGEFWNFLPAKVYRGDLAKSIFERLSKSLLANIAVKDTDVSIRRAAVDQLTDQTLLAEIAVKDMDATICRAAFEKINDQFLLLKISLEAMDSFVKQAAAEKLTDRSLLSKSALENEDRSVRRAAVEKLTDRSLLLKIAVEDKSEFVRRAAFSRLEVIKKNSSTERGYRSNFSHKSTRN
jgi:hypothetical protein